MSEVTAVPLRPIAKGTLTRLGLGIAAAVVGAAGLAWAGTSTPSACATADFFKGSKAAVTTPSGLMIQTVKAGTGKMPDQTDVVLVNYKGNVRGGEVFDQAQRAPLPVSEMIPGFTEALKLMQIGGTYRVCIPSAIGYGDKSPTPKIPANSTLIFDIDLLDFKSQAEIQAIQMQMQQMQAQGAMPSGLPQGMAPQGH